MFYVIDLRANEPRSAHETLGGSAGSYIFRRRRRIPRRTSRSTASISFESAINAAALADLRESVECEPEISDDYFMTHAESDIDNAAVRWLLDQRRIPPDVLAAINAAVDSLAPEAFIDLVK